MPPLQCARRATPRLVAACLVAACLIAFCGCAPTAMPSLDLRPLLQPWRAQAPPADARAVPAPPPRASRGDRAGAALTVDDAVALALVANPTARALRLEAGAVHLGAEVSGDWANPVFSTELRHAMDGAPDPWFVAAGLAFTVPMSRRHADRRAWAGAQAEAARLRAVAFEAELALAVRIAWRDWALARQREALLRDHAAGLEQLAALADTLARSGEVAPTTRGVLPLDHAAADVEALTAAAQAVQARQQVRALLGLAPAAPLPAPEAFEPAPEMPSRDVQWPEGHVDLQLAAAGYDVAQRWRALSQARATRDLQVGPSFELAEDRAFLGLTVQVPLPMLSRNRRAVAEAAGRVDAAKARVEAAAQGLHAAWARHEAAHASAEARIERLGGLIEAADDLLDELEALARGGELDPLALRHVTRQAIDARLARATAQRDRDAARLTLHALAQTATDLPPARGGSR